MDELKPKLEQAEKYLETLRSKITEAKEIVKIAVDTQQQSEDKEVQEQGQKAETDPSKIRSITYDNMQRIVDAIRNINTECQKDVDEKGNATRWQSISHWGLEFKVAALLSDSRKTISGMSLVEQVFIKAILEKIAAGYSPNHIIFQPKIKEDSKPKKRGQ